MQEVYLATDRTLERSVALKVPKNSAAERRFKRSAVLSARVNHPNVAKTLDYFDGNNGRFYLVEELVEGEDLGKARDQAQRFDPHLVAHVMHHLARGVAASHHVGVVHRDLKPSNVMVSRDLAFSEIKVTDFGIAKMAEAELAEAVEGGGETITTSHTVMGALPYLSPEMVEGPRDAGPPADIWAIGAIAFELLTGDKPFGRGLPAVKRILEDPLPILPDVCTSRDQFRALANDLYAIIAKCLEKVPADRPSADSVVRGCSLLCYSVRARHTGKVVERKFSHGFIDSDVGRVFFHADSVYGAAPKVGTRVLFSCYPGKPYQRAHPVIALQPGRPEYQGPPPPATTG